ncbi:MAG: C39 family peptidase [Clostridia bacterium]
MQIKERYIIFVTIILFLAINIFVNNFSNVNISKRDLLIEERTNKLSEHVFEWFNGKELKYYVGNNREYNWYIDQMDTGIHSNSNCGPSVAVMTLKWLNQDFAGTVDEAREMYYPQGEWWSLGTLRSYFAIYNVDYDYIFFDNEFREDKEENIAKIKKEINDNNIVILCLNMGYIPREYSTRLRTNKFYDHTNGHFIIVKGFVVVDNREYFEVYDPYSLANTYEDGSLKGKDRYYDTTSLSQAATNWSVHGFIIKESNNKKISD